MKIPSFTVQIIPIYLRFMLVFFNIKLIHASYLV